MNKGTKRLAIGTMIAGVAGYLAGILTAPKSGRETRGDIKDTANQTVAETEKQLKKLHTELVGLLDEAKVKGGEAKGYASKELDAAMEVAQNATTKVRTVLSAIHEGDAEDKDLQKAVKEATKAIDHIKTYLKK